ncbi:MAG: stage II sporulation protein M [Acidobacteriota bacterium]
MKRAEFIAHNEGTWQRLEHLLDGLSSFHWQRPEGLEELPELYRATCHHLALVRQRHLGPDLESRLHELTLRGARHLYRDRSGQGLKLFEFFFRDFPRRVRAEWKLFALANFLFYGPALAVGIAVLTEPSSLYSVFSPDNVALFEAMYSPGERERGLDGDLQMFGLYIQNNIGIGFRTFASGLLAGLGSVFFLVLNGLILGGLAAHLTVEGHGEQFWTFVIAHCAFEITALILAGAAGLKLGFTLLAPGRRTRNQALREVARPLSELVLGMAAMLVVAAIVEAFWSFRQFEPQVKYGVGAACWIVVAAYLGLSGLRRGS